MQLILRPEVLRVDDQGDGLGFNALHGDIPCVLPYAFGTQRVFNTGDGLQRHHQSVDK